MLFPAHFSRFSRFSFAAFVSALLLVAAPQAARAQTVQAAIDFTSFGSGGASFDSTRGYAFDIAGGGFTVTYLSVFDAGFDGLVQSHQVGIWDPAGNLLRSATVPSGTTAPLDSTGKFRMVAITPLTLNAASGYTVGAQYLVNGGDNQANFTSGTASFATNVVYQGTRFINTSSNGTPGILTRPTTTQTSINGIFGGSFGGTAIAPFNTPEPGTLPLLGMGLTAGLGIVGTLSRKREMVRRRKAKGKAELL